MPTRGTRRHLCEKNPLTVPTRAGVVPTPTAFDPACRCVVVAVARVTPMAGHPVVTVITPVPITRDPDVAITRRGHDLHGYRRRRDIHVEIDIRARGSGDRDAAEGRCDEGSEYQFAHKSPP